MTRSQRHKILTQIVASDGKSRGEGVRGYPDYFAGSYVPGVGVYNFAAARATKMINDLKAVKAGTGNAILIFQGDSNIWGEGGGDSGSNNRVNAKERCWPTMVAKRLTALGIPSIYESLYASGGNSGITAPADYQNLYKTGFSFTGTGWTFTGATSLGGLMWGNNNVDATSTIQIITQVACDTIELMYPIVSGNGIITYSIDGGSAVQLSQNATTAQKRQVIALGSVGIHTIVIKRFSGSVYFTGYRAWNSTIKQCQILNVGRCSSSTTDWQLASSPYASLNALQDISSIASGVFLCSTINDGLLNMPDATYNANYQALDTAAAAGGASVLYGTGMPSNLAQVSQAIQDRIRGDLRAKAIANSRIMFDMTDKYGTWVAMNALGLVYNQNHPNTAGYADWGTFVGDQLAGMAA